MPGSAVAVTQQDTAESGVGSRSVLWAVGQAGPAGPGAAAPARPGRSACSGSPQSRGQTDKRRVPAAVLAAVAAAGDRRGPRGGRARVLRPARGGRCAGLYNTYIIRALLSAAGWEGRPAVED